MMSSMCWLRDFNKRTWVGHEKSYGGTKTRDGLRVREVWSMGRRLKCIVL